MTGSLHGGIITALCQSGKQSIKLAQCSVGASWRAALQQGCMSVRI